MVPEPASLRKLAVANFCLEAQFWFPVWMLFLSHRGFDLTTMVLADGFFRFTMVALEFPLGVFSDRLGRKQSYCLIAVLAAATYAGIMLVSGRIMLFSVWFLWGAFWALSSGAASAYCYELVSLEGKQADSVAVFGFMRAVAGAAALLSHLAAGFLFSVSPVLPFAVNGALALGALGIAVTLPATPSGRRSEPLRGPQSFRRFLSISGRDATYFAEIVLLAVALVYFWSPRILMQPLFLELEITPALVSAVYFCYSLAGVIAGLAANRIRVLLGDRLSIIGGMALLWSGILLVALAPGRLSLLFFPLISFGFFLANTLLEVLLHHRLENRNRAAILSAASFLGGVFIIFARPGLGLLADWKNTPFAFQVWAGAGVAVLILFGLLIRKLPLPGQQPRSA